MTFPSQSTPFRKTTQFYNKQGGKNESAKKEAVLWDRDEIEMLVNTVGQMVAGCEDAGDVVNKLVQLVQVAMTSKVTDLTVGK